MCLIDTHIILVPVVRSNQNSCIKYSTQKQHFAKLFTYSDNTNYNLNFYYLLLQFNWDFIYSAIIHVSDVSDDPGGIFACCTASITAPSFDKQPEYALSVAVVDTRSLAGARNHCEWSVTIRTRNKSALWIWRQGHIFNFFLMGGRWLERRRRVRTAIDAFSWHLNIKI
jgi:hypothetical protein